MSEKSEDASAFIGVDLIGIVEKNTKRFCKALIEMLMKDWPGESYMVLSSKPIVPVEIPLLDVGYK